MLIGINLLQGLIISYIYKIKNTDYKINNWFYFGIFITSMFISIYLNLTKELGIRDILVYSTYLLSFQVLFILSVIDIKYYEINNFSYIFFIPGLIVNFFYMDFSGLISVLAMFSILFVSDLLKINHMGGADMKLMMLLVGQFEIYTAFDLINKILICTFILYIIYAIITKKFKETQIPMIVSIFMGYMLFIINIIK